MVHRPRRAWAEALRPTVHSALTRSGAHSGRFGALVRGQGGADDAGVVEQLRGNHRGAGAEQRDPLVRLLAHPATDDDQVGPDAGLQDVEVPVHPLRPLRVVEVVALPDM